MADHTVVDPTDGSTWPARCPKCDIELWKSRQCLGHSKRTGRHCGNRARLGHTVCDLHGARTPQARAAAARRLEQAEAQRAAATFGLPREIGPHEALLEELHRTAGHVAWLGALVADLQHETDGKPSVMGVDESEGAEAPHSILSGLKQYTREQGRTWEKPSVWVEMYQAERKHLTDVAAACVKAGVQEAQVRIAQQQADVMVQVMRAVLSDLGVAGHPDVNTVVARHLRAVSA